jgi:secreted trypsin-like serine protease
MKGILDMKFLIIFILLLIIHGFVGEKISERIFDGSEATDDAFPWMTALYYHDPRSNRTYHVCGGSIVSETYVLTAASCLFDAPTNLFNLFSIRAGIHNINDGSETEQNRSVSRFILHPNYNKTNYLNDLALVRVSPPFNFKGLNVKTISFSNLTSVESENLVTIGWGVYNRSNQTISAQFLQQATVQENVECTKNRMINSTTQLCATGKTYFLDYIRCSININQMFSSFRNMSAYVSRSIFNIIYLL